MAKKMKETAETEIVKEQPETQENAPAGEAQQEQAAYQLTQEQFDELKARIDALQKERDEYMALAQRVQADFDNFRRRNTGVRAESLDEGARETIKALLPALDSLERALQSAQESGEKGAFAEGVSLVHRQMCDTLAKLGVEPIESVGQTFDPELHNAVMQGEATDEIESGKVLEELQKGYKHKGKIIRHSMVKVAQ